MATADNEDYLLYRQVKRAEALEAENHRHDLHELSWHWDDDGSFVITGRLTPEQGARFEQVLEYIRNRV